jgi:hypothetical protein
LAISCATTSNFRYESKNTGRMYLLLFEARVRTSKTQLSRDDLLFLYFVLLTLTYLYETERQRKTSDSYQAIEFIYQSDPPYFAPFIVDKSSPSLRKDIDPVG